MLRLVWCIFVASALAVHATSAALDGRWWTAAALSSLAITLAVTFRWRPRHPVVPTMPRPLLRTLASRLDEHRGHSLRTPRRIYIVPPRPIRGYHQLRWIQREDAERVHDLYDSIGEHTTYMLEHVLAFQASTGVFATHIHTVEVVASDGEVTYNDQPPPNKYKYLAWEIREIVEDLETAVRIGQNEA